MLKVNVDEYAEKLDRPFLMASLAHVDNYLVSVYSCQGAMAWHRHLDEDELFIGYSGSATVETAWGAASLSFADLFTVPKGLPHRSLAVMPSILLLVQTRGMPSRRNGHQPADGGDGVQPDSSRLGKVSVAAEAAKLSDIYAPKRIASSDALAVSVEISFGPEQWHTHAGDELVFCQYGQLLIESDDAIAPLMRGELVVTRAGERHRLVAGEPTTVMLLSRMGP
jgi:quercetin dioxygenase-like cupin family protein